MSDSKNSQIKWQIGSKMKWLFPWRGNENNSMQGKILREKYRVKEKMGGKGGFGETFIAQSLSFRDDKLYVVKKLKPTITDPRIWEQFAIEASVLIELGLFHLLIPEVYDYFQQNSKYNAHYILYEHMPEKESSNLNPEQLTLNHELREQLDKALQLLPAQAALIFHLVRIKGFKYKEVAEKLGISVSSVDTQLNRAVKKLRISLKAYKQNKVVIDPHVVENLMMITTLFTFFNFF
ncbi:MAG: sigma-70 family RNA polymerase sigma factor [Bacteroidota bacterium]